MVSRVMEIPIENLTVSKFNVRKDLGDISELVDSIKSVGVLEPIIVRPTSGDKYEIVVGSRRFAAAKEANLKTIPAIVREMSDEEAIVVSLTENIQRGDLDLEEIVKAYIMINKLNPEKWTQKTFAGEIGKSQRWLSDVITAYQSLEKLRQTTGKQYVTKLHPTEEEKEKGVLPYAVLAEVEHALKAVQKVIPEEKIDEVRVKLVEAVKSERRENVKRILSVVKRHAEKIKEKGIEEGLSEIIDIALREETLKTTVPVHVMKKVEEVAKQTGKTVEVIVSTALEKGVEEEAKKVEVEKLLEEAPTHVVKVAREQKLTPKVIKELLKLPEEKQKEAAELIKTLRPTTEEEALSHIESVKAVEVVPEKEINAIIKRYEELQKRISEVAQRPDVRKRGELFKNWQSHYVIAHGLKDAFCPSCGKERSGKLVWSCCNLPAEEALKLAGDEYEKSRQELDKTVST